MQYSFKTGILRNIFVEAHCGDFPIHSVSQSAEKRAFLSEWRYLKSSAKKDGVVLFKESWIIGQGLR